MKKHAILGYGNSKFPRQHVLTSAFPGIPHVMAPQREISPSFNEGKYWTVSHPFRIKSHTFHKSDSHLSVCPQFRHP
jgi:hypothetical protein